MKIEDYVATSESDVGRLQIEGDGDLARVCDEAMFLLIQAKAPVYQRGGMLVRIVTGGEVSAGRIDRDVGAPRIVPFDDLSLAELMTRHLVITRRNRKTQEMVRVDCPRLVAQTLLARKEWDFPPLDVAVEHPVMLQDGSTLEESGYHPATGLFLSLPPFAFQAAYKSPSRRDAEDGLQKMDELLGGFDFVGPQDKSVALAYLLTAFVRPILNTAPIFAFDAHAAGSGKSTLARIGSMLATGREPAFQVYPADPAELAKAVFSALLAGVREIAYDNVDVAVASPVLAVISTGSVFSARVLGLSMNASVPTKVVISMNGNNLQVIGDLTRRILISRLDPPCERPAEREFEFNPVDEVRSMRSDYVLSALNVMSAYRCSAQRVSVKPFGSFEDWSRLVREPLVWLGMPDPCDSIRVLEESDPERGQLRSMLKAVNDSLAKRPFKVAELLSYAKKAQHQAELGSSVVRFDAEQRLGLAEALHAVCERRGELSAGALGKWLLRMNGRIEGGMRFVRVRQTSIASIWQIEVSQ